MSDDDDSDTYGVWDPIGNPHSDGCLCSNCGPTEYALNLQAERDREADKRARLSEPTTALNGPQRKGSARPE